MQKTSEKVEYRTDIPLKIWVYWENPEGTEYRPTYIELCEQTIMKYASRFDVFFLSELTIEEYIDVPDYVKNLKCLAHKADYYRAHVISKFGGIALDADTIILRDLWYIVEQLANNTFVGFGDTDGPRIGVFAAKKDSIIVKTWAKQQDDLLRNHVGDLGWAALGCELLWPICKKYPHINNNFNLTHPIDHEDFKKLLTDVNIESVVDEKTIAVSLFNSNLGPLVKDMGGEQLLYSNMLISKLFRKSLNVIKPVNKTVSEIIESYLKENGFDGLYNYDYECGCELGDIFTCGGEMVGGCKPGYKTKCTCGEENCDWHITETKEK
jgi:hypothetical protein